MQSLNPPVSESPGRFAREMSENLWVAWNVHFTRLCSNLWYRLSSRENSSGQYGRAMEGLKPSICHPRGLKACILDIVAPSTPRWDPPQLLPPELLPPLIGPSFCTVNNLPFCCYNTGFDVWFSKCSIMLPFLDCELLQGKELC